MLADRAPVNTRKERICAACAMERQMLVEDRATLQRWWDDPSYETMAIARRLEEEGYHPPPRYTLDRHRKRACTGRSS